MQGRRRLLAVFMLLLPAAAAAQESGSALQFNFSNPGARSLGLGGAFAGLADDATAAFANPAGLVQLTRPEVSLEGRHWQYTTPYVAGGRVTGVATGIGLDTHTGLRFTESSTDTSGVSFLSYVQPLEGASLAVFRYQLANFEHRSETLGLYAFGPGGVLDTVRRDERRQQTDIDVVSWGIAGAYRVSERFSVGLAVVYSSADLTLIEEEFDTDDTSVEGVFFDTEVAVPERLELTELIRSDDTAWSFNLGLLWQPSRQWSLGAFYRQGPEMTFRGLAIAGPLFDNPDFPDARPGDTLPLGSSPLKIPDVFGLGLAWRSPGEKLTVAVEWDRVLYSQIVEKLSEDVATPGDLELDDGYELHLGVEYAFLRRRPVVALRAGWWYDPEHQIRDTSGNAFDRAILRGGDDSQHLAVGLGVAFDAFQIDLATDAADFVDTFALSAIYSF